MYSLLVFAHGKPFVVALATKWNHEALAVAYNWAVGDVFSATVIRPDGVYGSTVYNPVLHA